MENDRIGVIRNSIRTIPDYPKKGILFRDITTLLKDEVAFRMASEYLVLHSREFSAFDFVAGIESRYDRDAKSEVAYGLFQITKVAQLHMNRLHNIELDRFNVVDNTTLGVLYWRWLRGIHGDDIVRMLAAFNWGPTNVVRVITPNTTGLDLTLLPQETRDYINKFKAIQNKCH